jgi:hypothetical protein
MPSQVFGSSLERIVAKQATELNEELLVPLIVLEATRRLTQLGAQVEPSPCSLGAAGFPMACGSDRVGLQDRLRFVLQAGAGAPRIRAERGVVPLRNSTRAVQPPRWYSLTSLCGEQCFELGLVPEEDSVEVWAAVLKDFFRELSAPVVPQSSYSECVAIGRYYAQGPNGPGSPGSAGVGLDGSTLRETVELFPPSHVR